MSLPEAALAIVRRWGSLLVVRGASGPRSEFWQLPAGGIEAGETPEDAVKRELKEETGLTAYVCEYAGTVPSPTDGRTVHVFVVTQWKEDWDWKPDGREIGQCAWVTKAQLLANAGDFLETVETLDAAGLLERDAGRVLHDLREDGIDARDVLLDLGVGDVHIRSGSPAVPPLAYQPWAKIARPSKRRRQQFHVQVHRELFRRGLLHPAFAKVVRKRVMAEISTKQRNALKKSQFALPDQRKYPIHDAAHTRNAAARLAQAKKRGKIGDADFGKARAAIRRAAKRFGIDTKLRDEGLSMIVGSAALDKSAGKRIEARAVAPAAKLTDKYLLDDGKRLCASFDDGSVLCRDIRSLKMVDEIDPASVGIQLKGSPTWADGSPKKLVWVQLAETGEWKGHPAGEFSMTPATFSEIAANFDRRGLPVPFDFEHASEQDPTKGSIPVTGAPAQGWTHKLDNKGAGGLWGLTEWIDDYVRDGIKAGKFAFLSPAIRFGSRDPVSGKPVGARITSAALTNQPFLTHLQGLVAATDRAGAGSEEHSMTDIQFKGGPKALLSAFSKVGTPQGDKSTIVTMADALEKLAHKPHQYMASVKRALQLDELATHEECADKLEKLRDQVSACLDANGDPDGSHEGIDLGAYTAPLKAMVDATPGDTWAEVFDAVEALIQAAIEEHEVREHGGPNGQMADKSPPDSLDAQIKTAAASATASADNSVAANDANTTNPAGGAPAPTAHGATNMADDNKQNESAKQLTDLSAKVNELSLTLTALGGKVDEQAQTIAAKDAEIKTLKDERAAREAASAAARVDEAFETHKDKMHLTEGHREQMAMFLASAPEKFEKLYPRVSPRERHLLANLTTGTRTPVSSGTVPGTVRGPSLRVLAVKLALERGIELADAQAIVYAAARKAREEQAAA